MPFEQMGKGDRIALGLAFLAVLWGAGILVNALRGPRPTNVVRYKGYAMGPAMWGLAFAIGFAVAGARQIEGWEGPGPFVLSAVMLACSASLALLTFRFAMALDSDAIRIRRIFGPGWRCVDWKSVRAWRTNPARGSIVLLFKPSDRYEVLPAYKEGFEALVGAIRERRIPHEAA